MCGIAGYLSVNGFSASDDMAEIAGRMADRLAHRGPNDRGVWTDIESGIALAHRRLSILDLSPAGHQPMLSHCGRFVMIFNGEIYNHLDIRKELDALPASNIHHISGEKSSQHGWRGHSDTETLLAAIATWGLEATLKKAVGMFAIALWDRSERTLSLARDRMGEKPLYYGLNAGVLLFASELKAFYAYPNFDAEVDRQSLALMLRQSAVPAPFSIYRGICKLQPGTILKLTRSDVSVRTLPIPQAYWSLRQVAEEGQRDAFSGSDIEAVDELERLLRQSISGQMLSDVPLGAFLSGGIDSSTVVALMQAQSARPVQTFSIGFQESGYNEAEYARAVAEHLGTKHTELYVSAGQAMDVIPQLSTIYDEPFADVSQIPTLLLSQMTREHVTVSLSGDGGDELFGGYNRYLWAPKLWRRLHYLPRNLRMALAGMLTVLPPKTWDKVFQGLNIFMPAGWRYATPGDKLHKLADVIAAKSAEEIYHGLISHWRDSDLVVNGFGSEAIDPIRNAASIGLPDLEHCMMYMDAVSYLPNDILTKVDRATMAVSLEGRVPFLDHRIIEFAWRLPLSMKIRAGQGKWVVRRILEKYVPDALIERPKMGFGVPLDSWLRGPLKAWAEALLDESRLQEEGFLNPLSIRKMWHQHLDGRCNGAYQLWDVLMFQMWLSDHQLSQSHHRVTKT